MNNFPLRQVHLDFHTSASIPIVGNEFSPSEFAETLKKSDVNSVTCFARCHHGWLYYDSKVFPELVHPELTDKNILAKQIDACHKNGIRVPIYTTVQWDGRVSSAHPEFCVVTPEGSLDSYEPHIPGFYGYLCVNTPYRDFLKAHLKEILLTLPVDGIFLDIVQERDCSCQYCLAGMKELGFNPQNRADRLRYAHLMLSDFKKEITQFIRSYNTECSIFYNAGHIDTGIRDSLEAYTHLEVESLPSGVWGYTHFPLAARYARTLGTKYIGMTGKFHTSWGDFHSLKNRAALEFECFSMLATGGGCSIGDQLSPSGKLDSYTYDLIGEVYHSVKEKEPWCINVQPISEVGLFNLEQWHLANYTIPMIGSMRMLEELGVQFDVIDSKTDFSNYKLLIMPDIVSVDSELAEKLQLYIANGGNIIASFKSGLDPDGADFTLPEFGIRKCEVDDLDWEGSHSIGKLYKTNNYCDFISPESVIHKGLPNTEHSMYMRGLTVEINNKSTELLGSIITPWFYRTPEHFCSHLHTPSSGRKGTPAVVRNGRIIYFSHPIFTCYREKGPKWLKTMCSNAIDLLIDRIIIHKGPSTLKILINEFLDEKKWIIHLLHYIPEKRSEEIEIIEDVIPLYQVEMMLQIGDLQVKGIRTVPNGSIIAYSTEREGRCSFSVPKINGHTMIEVAFL